MKWFWEVIVAFLGLANKTLLEPLSGCVAKPIEKNSEEMSFSPTPSQMVTIISKPTRLIRPTKVGDTIPWGVSKQIDEHTWTMKVGEDKRMATAREIFDALNMYREKRGSQRLAWDEKLANYAQSRADYFYSIKNVDGHKGFSNFLENEDGFEKLGFSSLGENISFGYQMEGVHLIEWIYAGDKPHDDNQLNNRWNFVGIGVKGTASALIFGAGKK